MSNINTEISMRILMSNSERRHLDGLPDKVLMPTTCESQALVNHRQTLEELSRSGGLAWEELFAILELRPVRQMTVIEIVDQCRKYHFI